MNWYLWEALLPIINYWHKNYPFKKIISNNKTKIKKRETWHKKKQSMNMATVEVEKNCSQSIFEKKLFQQKFCGLLRLGVDCKRPKIGVTFNLTSKTELNVSTSNSWKISEDPIWKVWLLIGLSEVGCLQNSKDSENSLWIMVILWFRSYENILMPWVLVGIFF